jgi:serine/threonine-protein kinase HipA
MTDDEAAQRRLVLFFDVFDGLARVAPGSDTSTAQALARLSPLPSAPIIADLGCGPGAASLVLARETGGRVLAVDLHTPFLAALRHRATAQGLQSRIHAVRGDMARPPIGEATLDLVWSEGAAYTVGTATALKAWRPLLRPGGQLVLSELVWLTDDRPADAREFWKAAYPAMADIDALSALVASAGFSPGARFVLQRSDWDDGYYVPLERRLAGLRAAHPGDPDAASVAHEIAREIELWRRSGHAWGYAVQIARAI